MIGRVLRGRGLAIVAGAAAACTSALHRSDEPQVPRTILARGENLLAARRRLAQGDVTLRPALAALLRAADSAMHGTPLSVTQKSSVPPSGDKHDYLSLAPYWWPDSTRAGGVPYVRRDGEINPTSRRDHDGLRLQATIDAAEALALAHFFTGDRSYADRAALLLRVFFVDTATRMKPNLRFAQVNDGRGIGIIDTRHMPQLVDAIRLLEDTPAWTSADRRALTTWCRAYLDWLLTSANGREERAASNNHGTWYDAQVAALSLFVGDSALAREIIGVSVPRRMTAQIAADGSQPAELARTLPLHYSLFNVDALTELAEMGRHVGIDLWARGGPLHRAVLFVAALADSGARLPTPDLAPLPPEEFGPPLRRAAAALGDTTLLRALAKLPNGLVAHRSHLLYPVALPAAEKRR